MSEHTNPQNEAAKSKLEQDVERIVESGENVRERVREAVEETVKETRATPSRLAELTGSTIEAATRAVERSTPQDPESTLHQVVDGLGDGLQRTANATRLALQEAAGEGKAYATEDLKGVADDFRTLSGMFVDSVEAAFKSAAGRTRDQAGAIRDHASRTIKSIEPSVRSAAEAAAGDPIGLAAESASSAVKLTRHATGALFSSIGGILKSAGDRLSPPDPDERS